MSEEVYEECPLCETEGCVWCDELGVVPHSCDPATGGHPEDAHIKTIGVGVRARKPNDA